MIVVIILVFVLILIWNEILRYEVPKEQRKTLGSFDCDWR